MFTSLEGFPADGTHFRRIVRKMKNIYRKVRLGKEYLISGVKSRAYRELFDGVEVFCMFLGYPRSGHTLISALLDAHPDIVLANELHAFRYIRYGFSRDQLFYLLLQRSASFVEKGFVHTDYHYAVPNQWQGRFRTLRVIGDKRGGGALVKLEAHPGLMEKLRERIDLKMKFVHVMRNPYDNISTMLRRSPHKTLERTVGEYFFYVQCFHDVRPSLGQDELMDVRHEAFIQNPLHWLTKLCGFLEVEAREDYLNDCVRIVYETPRKTRQDAPWNSQLIREVNRRMSTYPFLEGYSFYD